MTSGEEEREKIGWEGIRKKIRNENMERGERIMNGDVVKGKDEKTYERKKRKERCKE